MDEPSNGYAVDETGMLWQRHDGMWFSPRRPEGATWEQVDSRIEMQPVTVTPDTPVWQNAWSLPYNQAPFEAHLMVQPTLTFCGDTVPEVPATRRRPNAVPNAECLCLTCLSEWITNPEYGVELSTRWN